MSTLLNNAKAVIALTSWKARINTVGMTIFNLYKTCPGFHIVLTLSSDEFPTKHQELPNSLNKLCEAGICEILWVKKNVKAFKKFLFAMRAFPEVPIISADDDCLYKFNYANELYTHWLNSPKSCITYYCTSWHNLYITGGYATLYPPSIFGKYADILSDESLSDKIVSYHEDDCLYACLREKLNMTSIINLNKPFEYVAVSHDESAPLHDLYRGDIWKRHLDDMWVLINELP